MSLPDFLYRTYISAMALDQNLERLRKAAALPDGYSQEMVIDRIIAMLGERRAYADAIDAMKEKK